METGRDKWRLAETGGDQWRLVETSGDLQKLVETSGDLLKTNGRVQNNICPSAIFHTIHKSSRPYLVTGAEQSCVGVALASLVP